MFTLKSECPKCRKVAFEKNCVFVSFDAEFIFLYYKYVTIPDVKKSKL